MRQRGRWGAGGQRQRKRGRECGCAGKRKRKSLVRVYVHTYTYMHAYIHTHTHTYIHIHTCMHAYIHIHIRTYIYTYVHTYTYMHAYIHTYTYTYVHTYQRQRRRCRCLVARAQTFLPCPAHVPACQSRSLSSPTLSPTDPVPRGLLTLAPCLAQHGARPGHAERESSLCACGARCGEGLKENTFYSKRTHSTIRKVLDAVGG